MNRSAIRIACLAAALLQAGFAQTPACGGHGDRNTMIVTTSWLADHLNDPNLVILSVGQKADYEASHIPGALYLDTAQIAIRTAPAGQPGLNAELPPMAQLKEIFEKLGVNNQSHIILYWSNDQFARTTRVYLTLDGMIFAAPEAAPPRSRVLNRFGDSPAQPRKSLRANKNNEGRRYTPINTDSKTSGLSALIRVHQRPGIHSFLRETS
jgi:rhodanese-related sulfurtransferase